MKSFLTLFASILALATYVSAHGYVSAVAIDGQLYNGNPPNSHKPFASPIRMISIPFPIYGANNTNLTCGNSAQKAQVVAAAKPGSKLTFSWQSGNTSPGQTHWPHDTGPMMTYMAACEGTTCDNFDASGAKWFKIHQVGLQNIGSANAQRVWYQKEIMNGNSLTVPLPNNIKPGDYLVRHEILALHLANEGKAEYYPSCTQIRISGSGTGVPSQTVSFPGGYHDSDPGILDLHVYDPGANYTFPGPPVDTLAASDSSAKSPSGSVSSSNSTSGSPADINHCMKSTTAQIHKRKYSRIMRRLLPHQLS